MLDGERQPGRLEYALQIAPAQVIPGHGPSTVGAEYETVILPVSAESRTLLILDVFLVTSSGAVHECPCTTHDPPVDSNLGAVFARAMDGHADVASSTGACKDCGSQGSAFLPLRRRAHRKRQ